MKDNENPVLLGGVSYDETNLPYQLEADYDEDNEEEKYLQRASILFDYPYEKEENTFIGLGLPNDNITISYNYPNKPIESNVRDLRKEQDIIASQAKANRVYVPEKQNNQRIDYINKPLMNNGLTYIPEKNEIEMKPKKPIKQEKNYEEIANWFYPNMPEKSQIQETKRIPLLAENNQEPIKYYDDYSTLADRNYVVEPIQESFTGGAAKIDNQNSYNEIKNMAQTENDKNFFMALDIVFGYEGKYANNPFDKGGPTNMGITQSTYDDYCCRHNLPKKDVKFLSKDEIIQVYYNDYWIKAGLQQENDPIVSLILFDTAVLYGPETAKKYYKKSNKSLYKLLELRKKHHIEKIKQDKTQKRFEDGWNNRINRLKKILDRYDHIKR